MRLNKKFSPSSVVMQIIVLSLALGLASGCNQSTSVDKYLQDAQQYRQKGDNKAAIIQLKNALQKNADHAEARYQLGIIYNELGDFLSAEKEVEKARRLGYARDKTELALAQAWLGQGEFQKVLDLIQTQPEAAKGKNLAGILTARGEAHLGLNQNERAKESFSQALQSLPNYTPAQLGLARVAASTKNIDVALQQVEVALASAPTSKEAWLLKGDLLQLQGGVNPAVAAYQQVLKIDPNDLSAHLNLASLNMAIEKFDAARSELDAARKIAPNHPIVMYMQALLDFRQGKYSAARDALQNVLKVAPNHLPSILLEGMTSYSLETYELAERGFSRFLQATPEHVYARKMLVATLLKSNQGERALEALKPLLAKQTEDPQLYALAGEAYLQNQDFGKATQNFEKAVALQPKSAELRTQLGMSRIATGSREQAMADLEVARQLDSKESRADTLLVLMHLSKKEYDKALAAVNDLKKKLPTSAMVFNMQGAVYLGKKDFAQARTSFEQALAVEPTFIAAAANLAKLDVQDKNPKAARARFESVLAKDKKNLQAQLALASLAGSAGQEKEYIDWLEKAANSNPSALEPRLQLARYYLHKKEPQKALSIAREAKNANSNNPVALDLLGSTQLAAGEKDNALATYTHIVEVTPKSPAAYLKLAAMQSVMQNARATRTALNKALELKPDYLDAQVALIALETKEARYAEALKLAQQVQVRYPKAPDGFILEGDVSMAQKQFAPAIKAYEVAFNKGKSATLAIKLHQATMLAGNTKEADVRLLQWLKQNPADNGVRLYLAENFMKTKQYPPAIEQYELVIKQVPNNILALNNLSWLYQQTKDPRGVSIAEQALKLAPEDPAVIDTLGWILVEQGNAKRGLELLQKASSRQPDNPDIRYHLAVGLLKSGDKVRARQELQRILDSGVAFADEKQAQALLKQLPEGR